jgi:hypothetical protein
MHLEDDAPYSFTELGRQAEDITNRLAKAGNTLPNQSHHDAKRDGRENERTGDEQPQKARPVAAKGHTLHRGPALVAILQKSLELELASRQEFKALYGRPPKPSAARTNPRNQRSRE